MGVAASPMVAVRLREWKREQRRRRKRRRGCLQRAEECGWSHRVDVSRRFHLRLHYHLLLRSHLRHNHHRHHHHHLLLLLHGRCIDVHCIDVCYVARAWPCVARAWPSPHIRASPQSTTRARSAVARSAAVPALPPPCQCVQVASVSIAAALAVGLVLVRHEWRRLGRAAPKPPVWFRGARGFQRGRELASRWMQLSRRH